MLVINCGKDKRWKHHTVCPLETSGENLKNRKTKENDCYMGSSYSRVTQHELHKQKVKDTDYMDTFLEVRADKNSTNICMCCL